MATVNPVQPSLPTLPDRRPRPRRPDLPTMYDLPSDYPEDPGLPDQFHLFQPQLLEATFQPTTYPPEAVLTAIDLNVYYDPEHLNWYKRPDWFAALGVEEMCNEEGLRLSYVVWQEAAAPYLVVELLSPGKEQEDLGTAVRDAQQPPNKWQVYEQWLQVPYYVVFSRFTDELHYFHWQDGRYHEVKPVEQRLWLPEAGIGLGLWYGVHRRRKRHWLRFYDADGRWIPTPLEQQEQCTEQERQQVEQERQQTKQAEQRAGQERQRAEQERRRAEQQQQRAEQERQRAEQQQQRAEQEWLRAEQQQQRAEQAQQQTEQELQRAERLAAKLRALGIEPDE